MTRLAIGPFNYYSEMLDELNFVTVFLPIKICNK